METITTSTHLAKKLLMNIQCSGGLISFAKETRALKMSIVASHWKLTTTERITKATTREGPRTQCRHSMVTWHLKQIGKVKKLGK